MGVIFLQDVNDSMESAHELGALLSTRKCLLNLIPYNNTAVDAKYQQPSLDIIAKFADIVMREYGVRTTIHNPQVVHGFNLVYSRRLGSSV